MKQRFNKLTGNAPPVKCLRPRVRSASTDAASSSKVQMPKPRRLRRGFCLTDQAPRVRRLRGSAFDHGFGSSGGGRFVLMLFFFRWVFCWALGDSSSDDRDAYKMGTTLRRYSSPA